MNKMSSFSNNPLQDLLASIPDILLIILFYNLKALHALIEFLPRMIPYLITKWKQSIPFVK